MRPNIDVRHSVETRVSPSLLLLLYVVVSNLLAGCMVIRSEQAANRLQEMVEKLPLPPNVTVVDEVTGIAGGSDEKCYTAYLDRLVGSNHPPGEVLLLYETVLLSEGEWEEIAALSGDQRSTFYNRSDGFRLSIHFNLGAYNDFAAQSITKAKEQFDAPFIITASHADTETRKRCWPGWEQR